MNPIKIFTTAGCLTILSVAAAQTPSVNWFTGGDITPETYVGKTVEHDAKGFCIANVMQNPFALAKMSAPVLNRFSYPDCKLVYSVDLNKTSGEKLRCIGLLPLKDNLILLREGTTNIYAQTISIDNGTVNDNKVPVTSFPAGGEYRNMWNPDGVYGVAADGSAFVSCICDTTTKTLSLAAFGNDLTSKWSKTITAPFGKDWFYPLDCHMSADGKNAYLVVVRLFNTVPKGKHPGVFYIICYNSVTNAITTNEIDLGDKWLSSYDVAIDTKGNIICAGFYAGFNSTDKYPDVKTAPLGITESDGAAAGSFYMRIDHTTFKTALIKTTPFTNDFNMHYLTAKDIAGGYEISHLTLDTIIPQPDNSAIICAEVRHGDAEAYAGSSAATSYSSVSFYFDDMVVGKFNPDGSMGTMANIAKVQYTDYLARHCSYSFFLDSNNVYLAYNDNKKNLNLKPDVVAKENRSDFKKAWLNYKELGAHNVLMLAKVNLNDGTVQRTCLTTKKDKDKMVFCPAVSVQFTTGSPIILHEAHGEYEFGKLTLSQ